jgi:hypothetical protein
MIDLGLGHLDTGAAPADSASQSYVEPSKSRRTIFRRQRCGLFGTRPRHAKWAVSLVVFVAAVMVLSNFSGLARATSGAQITLAGMKPLTLQVGQIGKIFLNVTNGTVSATYPYQVYWFFGKTNVTSLQTTTQTIAAPAGCTLAAKCATKAGTNVTVSYSRPGSYEVSVTVYDGKYGNYSVGTDLVTVYDSFGLCFAIDGTNNVAPRNLNATEGNNIVKLDAQAQPNAGASYYWTFGDGSSTFGNTTMSAGLPCTNDKPMNQVTHSYFHSGTYLITLTVTDTWGFAVRKFAFVNVTDAKPAVSISGPGNSGRYSNVTFTAAPSSADGTASYSWSTLEFVWRFGDGTGNFTSVINGQNCTSSGCVPVSRASHSYNSTGTFTVKVWVTDAENQAGRFTTATASMPVVVHSWTVFAGCNWAALKPVGTTVAYSMAAGCAGWASGPWLNVTTGLGTLGSAYGSVANVPLVSYGSPTVPITVKTLGGTTLATSTGTLAVADSAPFVGVTGVYVEPNITLTMGACTFTNVTLTVLENGVTPVATGYLGSICGAFTPPSTPQIVLPPVALYFGNNYSIKTVYAPFGSGSSSGTLTLSYAGTGAVLRTLNWNFINGNPSTYTWTAYANPQSLGEPAFVRTEMLSLADTSLTTTWNFGDNTPPVVFTSPAPSSPGPSLSYHTVQHLWATGHLYSLSVSTKDPVVGTQGGLTGQDAMTVTESAAVSISDSAPLVQIPGAPSTLRANLGGEWNISATNLDLGTSDGAPACQFGDGSSASGSQVVHKFALGGVYFVVCFTASSSGSVGMNFSLVHVGGFTPNAQFFFAPISPSNNAVVQFNASRSSAGLTTASSLLFGWNFGDGTSTTGLGALGYSVQHIYASAGTFTVYLTVADLQGHSGSAVRTIHVGTTSISNGAVAGATVVASRSSWFNVTGITLSPGLLPYLNTTWTWGGGFGPFPTVTYGSYGLDAVHAYLIPGTYTATATLTFPGLTPTVYHATIVVVDPGPAVSFAFQGATIYGENHTATFNATALGTWADTVYPLVEPWNFTWNWGDGTSNTATSSTNGTTYGSHQYLLSTQVLINLSVTSPWHLAYRSAAHWGDRIALVPDSDGDGLPNVLERSVLHLNPYETSTGFSPPGQQWGTGFTDFLIARTNGLLTNLTSDPDGDGLTSAQEVFGSVTGFVSNPLDANTAGDGIPDGGHFFTDRFPASNVVGFNSTSPVVFVTIPNVWYGGLPTGFNQSRLTVQVSMAPARVAGNISLWLFKGNPWSGASWVALPSPTNTMNTYYLLNDSPQGGVSSSYAFTLADLAQERNWTLEVQFFASNDPGGSGSLPAVAIANSYYTDPSHADPYAQGMLEGNTLITPVFNCSAPKNETFPTVNAATFFEQNVSFWPYSQAYYKLSLIQGVPYLRSTNASVATSNSAACPGLLAHPGDMATYLGDADFGISPWNTHAAGDPVLSNGMKALGASNYTATVWQYENATSGTMYITGGSDPYRPDPGTYSGQTDPTSYSTPGDGVADSQSISPILPLAVEVTINWGRDPGCTTTSDSSTLGYYGDTIAAYGVGSQYSQTDFTPQAFNPSGGTLCSNGQTANYTYTFNDRYLLPLNNNGSRTFTIEFDLYHTAVGGYLFENTTLVNGSTSSFAPVKSALGAPVNATIQVVALSRAPTILFNTSEELGNISGYGLRYTGENQFYAIYVNASSSSWAPFRQGLNTILESRKAFLASPLNGQLVNQSEDQTCFGTSQVTTRGNSSSEAGITGTWNLNLTSRSCADKLLNGLTSRNATGISVGRNWSMSTVQFELLGLGNQTLQVSPLLPPSGWVESPEGAPPTGSYPFQGAIETAFNFFAAAWLAISSLYALAAKIAAAIGQFVLGLILKALALLAAAAARALSDLEALANYLVALAASLLRSAVAPLVSGVASLATCVTASVREVNFEMGHGKSQTQADQDVYANFWSCIAGPIFWGAIALAVAIMVALAIIEGFTLGAGFLAGVALGLIITGAIALINYSSVNLGPVRSDTHLPGSQVVAFSKGFASNTTGRPPSGNNSTSYRGASNNSTSTCNWGNGSYGNLSGCTWSPNETQVWSFLAGNLVLLLDYKGGSLALQQLREALGTQNVWVKAFNVVGFALAAVSLLLDVGSLLVNPEPRVAAVGLAIGVTALIMTGGCLAYQAAFPDPENPIVATDAIGVGLSLASTGVSAWMYKYGY